MATQWQRLAAAAVLATVGLGLGACGGGSDDDKGSADGKETDNPVVSAPSAVGGGGSKIEVTGKEFSYTPAKLTLKAGQPSTIALKNTGSIEHDLTLDEAGFKLSVTSGQTADKELKVDKPGTYEFHCSVAGHKDAGMKGELTVE
jgi:uncharacterized cupredoxin-like copper-binding protein